MPSQNYMALCKNDCGGEAGADLDWFKVDEATFDPSTGLWPTEGEFYQTRTYSFKIPNDIPSG